MELERLIVNCGTFPQHPHQRWRIAANVDSKLQAQRGQVKLSIMQHNAARNPICNEGVLQRWQKE
jgi:hypothetical protein